MSSKTDLFEFFLVYRVVFLSSSLKEQESIMITSAYLICSLYTLSPTTNLRRVHICIYFIPEDTGPYNN